MPACARLNRTESMEHASLESEDNQLAEALNRSAQEASGMYMMICLAVVMMSGCRDDVLAVVMMSGCRDDVWLS